MSEKPAEQRAQAFFLRPDILAAQNCLNVWGTCRRFWADGGRGIPSLDWIDGTDERFARIKKAGREWLENASLPSAYPNLKVSGSYLLVLGVDAIIGEFGNPPVLEGLLLHRYPCDGPMAIEERDRAYRLFRPELLMQISGHLRGRYMELKIDQLLAQMEREFLVHMADVGMRRAA